MTNPIADPLVEVPDTDSLSDLVSIEATPQGAVTVTINRPAKRNAFNAEVISALLDAFKTLETQEHVLVRDVHDLAAGWAEEASRRKHIVRLLDSLPGDRNCGRHGVAVEVGVVSTSDERVNLDGLALRQHRVEGHDVELVQSWVSLQ